MITEVFEASHETEQVATVHRPFGAIIFGHAVALAAVAAYGFAAFAKDTQGTVVPVGTAVLIALFGWSVISWRWLSGRYFDPYILFLASMFLFHAGQLVVDLVGASARGVLGDRYNDAAIAPAILLVCIAFWAFHSGALLVFLKPRAEVVATERDSSAASRGVGLALILIALIPFLLISRDAIVLRANASYIAFYQQSYGRGLDTWKLVLAELLTPGALFLLAGSQRHRFLQAVAIGCIVADSSVWMLIGERSHAVMPLLAGAWLWHSRLRRLPKLPTTIAALLLLASFPVLGILRNDPLAEHTTIASASEAFETVDNPFAASFSEMGNSLQSVVDTLQLVPATRPHEMGVGYLHALLNVFPNFIEFLHFDLRYGPVERWYVETVDPAYAAQGGSWGYSMIAEAYLEFGWIGGPLFIAVLGACIAGLSRWGSESSRPAAAAAVAAWWVIVLHFPRGYLESYTRQFVWWALAPYAAVAIWTRLRPSPQSSEFDPY